MKEYKFGDTIYEVDDKDLASFRNKYPTSVVEYTVGDTIYEVNAKDEDQFLAKHSIPKPNITEQGNYEISPLVKTDKYKSAMAQQRAFGKQNLKTQTLHKQATTMSNLAAETKMQPDFATNPEKQQRYAILSEKSKQFSNQALDAETGMDKWERAAFDTGKQIRESGAIGKISSYPITAVAGVMDLLTGLPLAVTAPTETSKTLSGITRGLQGGIQSDANMLERLAYGVVYSLPMMLSYAIGGAVAGTVMTQGMMTNQMMAQDIKDNKLDNRAVIANTLSGGLQAITETVFAENQLKTIGKLYGKGSKVAARTYIKKLINDTVSPKFWKTITSVGKQEMIEEIGQYAEDLVLQTVVAGKPLPSTETILKEAMFNGLGGLIGGAVIGGIGTGMQVVLNTEMRNYLKTSQTQVTNNINSALGLIEQGNYKGAADVIKFAEIEKPTNRNELRGIDLVKSALNLAETASTIEQSKNTIEQAKAQETPTVEPPVVDETVPNVEPEAITPVETTTESIQMEEPVKTKETEQPIEKPKKKSKIKTGEEIDIQFAKEELSDIKKQIKAETDENVIKRLQKQADKLSADIIKMEMESKQEEAKPVTLEVETIKEVPKAKEVPKIEIPEKTATDKTGKSKIGLEIIEDAVSKGLIDSGESAEFVKVNKKEQAQLATKLLNEGIDKAMEVAKKGVMPKGYEKLRTSALLNALRAYNQKNPTGKLTRELAKSTIVEKSSVTAQELGLLESQGERVLDKIVNKIDKSLEPRAKKFSKAEKKLVNKHKSEFDAEVKKRNTPSNWIKFIEAIECPT